MKKDIAETIIFEREKLYQEIWAEPVMQVAKRYGISDVGLAKICKKMKIPSISYIFGASWLPKLKNPMVCRRKRNAPPTIHRFLVFYLRLVLFIFLVLVLVG